MLVKKTAKTAIFRSTQFQIFSSLTDKYSGVAQRYVIQHAKQLHVGSLIHFALLGADQYRLNRFTIARSVSKPFHRSRKFLLRNKNLLHPCF